MRSKNGWTARDYEDVLLNHGKKASRVECKLMKHKLMECEKVEAKLISTVRCQICNELFTLNGKYYYQTKSNLPEYACYKCGEPWSVS